MVDPGLLHEMSCIHFQQEAHKLWKIEYRPKFRGVFTNIMETEENSTSKQIYFRFRPRVPYIDTQGVDIADLASEFLHYQYIIYLALLSKKQ